MLRKLFFLMFLFLHSTSQSETLVKVVIPYANGGGVTNLFRTMEEYASRQNIKLVPEFRPGAEATIGINYAATLPPDGNSLLLTNISDFTYNPKIKFNPNKLSAVTAVAGSAMSLTVNSSLGINSLDELLSQIKSGKQFTWSMPSPYINRLTQTFLKEIGANLNNGIFIPFHGAGAAVVQVAGGHVDLGLFTSGLVAGLEESGKIRVLATAVDPASSQNIRRFDHLVYKTRVDGMALFVPAGTSEKDIDRWIKFVDNFVKDPIALKNLEQRKFFPRPVGQEFLLNLLTND